MHILACMQFCISLHVGKRPTLLRFPCPVVPRMTHILDERMKVDEAADSVTGDSGEEVVDEGC